MYLIVNLVVKFLCSHGDSEVASLDGRAIISIFVRIGSLWRALGYGSAQTAVRVQATGLGSSGF